MITKKEAGRMTGFLLFVENSNDSTAKRVATPPQIGKNLI